MGQTDEQAKIRQNGCIIYNHIKSRHISNAVQHNLVKHLCQLLHSNIH